MERDDKVITFEARKKRNLDDVDFGNVPISNIVDIRQKKPRFAEILDGASVDDKKKYENEMRDLKINWASIPFENGIEDSTIASKLLDYIQSTNDKLGLTDDLKIFLGKIQNNPEYLQRRFFETLKLQQNDMYAFLEEIAGQIYGGKMQLVFDTETLQSTVKRLSKEAFNQKVAIDEYNTKAKDIIETVDKAKKLSDSLKSERDKYINEAFPSSNVLEQIITYVGKMNIQRENLALYLKKFFVDTILSRRGGLVEISENILNYVKCLLPNEADVDTWKINEEFRRTQMGNMLRETQDLSWINFNKITFFEFELQNSILNQITVEDKNKKTALDYINLNNASKKTILDTLTIYNDKILFNNGTIAKTKKFYNFGFLHAFDVENLAEISQRFVTANVPIFDATQYGGLYKMFAMRLQDIKLEKPEPLGNIFPSGFSEYLDQMKSLTLLQLYVITVQRLMNKPSILYGQIFRNINSTIEMLQSNTRNGLYTILGLLYNPFIPLFKAILMYEYIRLYIIDQSTERLRLIQDNYEKTLEDYEKKVFQKVENLRNNLSETFVRGHTAEWVYKPENFGMININSEVKSGISEAWSWIVKTVPTFEKLDFADFVSTARNYLPLFKAAANLVSVYVDLAMKRVGRMYYQQKSLKLTKQLQLETFTELLKWRVINVAGKIKYQRLT